MTDTDDSSEGDTEHFQRWYDQDITLGELVKILETLSDENQLLFAFLMSFFSKKIIQSKGRQFFRELEWEKLLGLYKSKKNSRRWYDREPALQKAFNQLYSLNISDQGLIAKSLHVPSVLAKRYEDYCNSHQKPLNMDEIHGILATSFRDGPEEALQIYSVLH